jgi:hypothetical protein
MDEWMNGWIAAERMQAKEKRAFFRNVLSHHASQSSRRLTSPLASFSFLFEFAERFLSAGRSAVPSIARIATDGFLRDRDHFQV